MGAREDLLAAARALGDRGITVFAPVQLIAEARSLGSNYPDTTLRTFIIGPMCVNSPDHHAVQYGDLERVARGLYRLASSSEAAPVGQPHLEPPDLAEAALGEADQHPLSESEMLVESVVESPSTAGEDPWFWEGNVQAAVVGHLVSDGWRIRRVANTATSEHGVDIEASRAGEDLLIEVKGYPGSTYQRGNRRGEPKATPAAPQARAYFSNALLSGLIMRADSDAARVALAFPDLPTYRNLGQRVAAPLAAAGIEVWFVTEDGTVARTPNPRLRSFP